MNKVADILLEEEKPLDIRYFLNLIHKKLPIIITIFVIAVTIASIYAARIPVRYRASSQLILEASTTALMKEGFEGVASYQPHRDAFNSIRYDNIEEAWFKTQKEVMMSASVLKKVIEELNLTTYFQVQDSDSLVGLVRRMLMIERKKGSRIIHINVTAESGKLAADLSNSVAENFLRVAYENLFYYDRNVLDWLDGGGREGEYITITDPVGRVTRLKYEELIDSLPPIQTDPTIRELKTKLQTVKSDLESYLRQYREKHPIIIKTRSDIEFLENSIEQEKKRIIETLKARAGGQMGMTPGRIIEHAKIPQNPIKERRLFIVIIAGVLSLIAGALLVFAMDYFDDTLRIMEDFERKGILLPFLGPLPLMDINPKTAPGKVTIVPQLEDDDSRTAVEEAFRYLRVAINFSAPPETVKTLVITSCLPGDGKSFVSTNLAASLAIDGNKVLLVDGDLRRPVIHATFDLENETGLSNYLTSHVDIDAVAKESPVENLSIVCSGPISPNPSEILGSDRMKDFVKEASEKYDRVIIDCPPLTGIGDGFVVGGLIGHLILVVGAGKTPADLIRHTQQQVDKMGIKILGTVLNRMDLREERYGGYTHHYYHTYNKYYKRSK